MKTSTKKQLRRTWLWGVAGLIFVVVLVFMAQPATSSMTPAPLAEPDHQSQQTVQVAPNPVPDEQLTNASTTVTESSVETTVTAAALPSSDNCVTCHTDKEQLKALAEEPEEVKSAEAEGEG